ncbi:MAG: LysR family transcriptional regulator [Pseudomonadota bacterium]
MIDAYLLRYFLAVVEEGGFTKAAERSNVTQPTLSAGIKKLEDHLGVLLFDRSARRIQITPAGSKFLVRAQAMIREYNYALRDLEGLQPGNSKRPLRLGLSHTLPAAMVASLCAAVAAARPDRRLEVSEGTAQDLGNRLAQRRVDMSVEVSTASDPSGTALFEEGYSLALPEAHPMAGESLVDATELAQDTMIARRRCEVLQATSLHFTSRNVRPPIGLRTTNCDKAMVYVARGLGVTVAPDCYQYPGVRRVKMKDFSPRRSIMLNGGDSILAQVLRQALSPYTTKV